MRITLSLIPSLFVIVALLLVGCSTIILEPVIAENLTETTHSTPKTKSSLEPEAYSDAQLIHFTQSNHYLILMHHVEFRDSVFVQTLTEEDMATLNITEEEQVFGHNYVVQLNELIK